MISKPCGTSSMGLADSPEFFNILVDNYKRLLGQDPPFLAVDVPADARWLYSMATACVLAHNTAPDPRFIYANKAAQALFGYTWDEFVGLPSRLSAEAPNREERQRLLDAVSRDGFATGYAGIRINKSGQRFRIEDGVLWELRDAKDELLGVAATFGRWTYIE